MVLDIGDDDLIPGIDKFAAETVGNEIDRLGGATGEDNFLFRRRTQKIGDLLPRFLIKLGRPLAQSIRTAAHGSIFLGIKLADPVNNRLRFLSGRSVI